MAKKGMFGWLGFGRKNKEQSSDSAVEVEEKIEIKDDQPEAVVEAEQVTEVSVEIEEVGESELEPVADTIEPEIVTAPEPEIEEIVEAELEPVADIIEPEIVTAPEPEIEEVVEVELVAEETAVDMVVEPEKKGFFARLKAGLKRTKENFGSGFFSLFKGKKIDDDLFDELEESLLIADVGVDTTLKVIKSLTEGANRKQLKDGEALYELLQQELADIIEPVSQPLVINNEQGPYVILMVGVNGVGKTTTIGKLAKKFQLEGKKVALAAGDTFRAAAVEQLQVWGERNDITVIAQHTGADSASVIFDAVQAAKARNIDVLIADTAGRLQNKAHLMDELKKIVRVMKKLDDNAPHEVMLTLDAGTGQNAISQVELFHQAVGVTGLTLTKLDGTAKGGVVFALADKFGIPIRYIGVGEGIDDLREFNSKEFIDALFSQDEK